jgi:hypothetical protein
MLCNYIETKWIPTAEKAIQNKIASINSDIQKLGTDPSASNPTTYLQSIVQRASALWVSALTSEFNNIINIADKAIWQAPAFGNIKSLIGARSAKDERELMLKNGLACFQKVSLSLESTLLACLTNDTGNSTSLCRFDGFVS